MYALIIIIVIVLIFIFARGKDNFAGDPDIIHQAGISYYRTFPRAKYGDKAIIAGFHYSPYDPYSRLMFATWQKLKHDLATSSNDYSGVHMFEVNDDNHHYFFVDKMPQIFKWRGGKMREYTGRADYKQLKEFILGTSIVDTYGAAF